MLGRCQPVDLSVDTQLYLLKSTLGPAQQQYLTSWTAIVTTIVSGIDKCVQ